MVLTESQQWLVTVLDSRCSPLKVLTVVSTTKQGAIDEAWEIIRKPLAPIDGARYIQIEQRFKVYVIPE